MHQSNFIAIAQPNFAFSAAGFAPFFIILGLILAGVLYIAYTIFVSSKMTVKMQEVDSVLNDISKDETSWNKEEMKQFVETSFYKIRASILEKDMNVLKTMFHPSLYEKWEEQVIDLSVEPDQRTEHLNVEHVEIVDVKNYKDDEKDTFTASIGYSGPEYTIHRNGKLKMLKQVQESDQERSIMMTEYWTFEKEKDVWTLINADRQGGWKNIVKSKSIHEK